MKFWHIALGATLSICALGMSVPAAPAAQPDDVLKRLEALEQENTALRDRVRRLEGRKVEQTASATGKMQTATTAALPAPAASAANAMAAYNAVPAAPFAYNWTGFYVGGHVGGGFQNTTVEDP